MRAHLTGVAAAILLTVPGATAQTPPPPPAPTLSNPTLAAIWGEGMDRSRVAALAQVLLDSLGPRLTGTPQSKAASDWVVGTYRSWGIDARAEQYGTWRGWRRGITHLDLVAPRVRSLEATMLGYSPGTSGPLTGQVVLIPHLIGPAALTAFLPTVRGKFVMLTAPESSCRPSSSWEEWADSTSLARRKVIADSTRADWVDRARSTGATTVLEVAKMLEDAGAAGVLSSYWSQGWGVDKVFQASTETIPQVQLSCEDYGLIWRLAANGQGPVVRLEAEAELLGDVPVANTIGMIRGREKPDEYVMLSAHFDSWDGGSGATDNGTGTVMMMEVMRILKQVYPNPKRTILVGHWNGEEQGLNGSSAFAADHPEILARLQVLLNQDDGTGGIDRLTMEGLVGPGPYFKKWMDQIPQELDGKVTLVDPGTPGRGGTDNFSFVCNGAPGFGLNSAGWDYGTYTWHTNRDTYDKIGFEELRRNATLAAMLAYLASEEPEKIPLAKRDLPMDNRSDQPGTWPVCGTPDRSFVR